MAFEKLINRRAVERQKRKNRSKQIKSLVLERGLDVFKKYGIHKIVVFGSVANGVYGEMSDIVILVMPLKNSQFWNFRFEIAEAIVLPIDLYTDLDDPIFVEKIISRGDTIYDV